MFLYPDAQRFSVFLVARGLIQGSSLAASNNSKVEGGGCLQQKSQPRMLRKGNFLFGCAV